MMNLPSIKEITNKAKHAFKRFPITLSWSITGSLILIGIINVDADLLFDEYINSLLTMVLGVSWLIGSRFFIEQLKDQGKGNWLKFVVIGLLVLFYLHLPNTGRYDLDPKLFIRFWLYFLAGHLFVFVAPFILKWDPKAYWNYLKCICIAIGRSILFSGVLYLGLVLALAAIQALFDVDIDAKRYGQLFVLCLGIVNTWTYLSDFPKTVYGQRSITYNKALEVFVKYILIPLVLLYMIILYAYAFKILLQWSLPKGWVSYLVTALALLGFSIQVMVNPVQKTIKSWIINRFYPWFYILLLPLIILLFVAIFRRISDYGVTENRYFVLTLALWILGMVLYLLFSKKRPLKVLPISLGILTILSSFGFWGAFSVSKKSQLNQFSMVYKAVKSNGNLASDEQYERLRSIISYFAESKSINHLDEVVGLSTHEICKDTSESRYRTYSYGAPQRLLDSLAIKLDPKTSKIPLSGTYYKYYGTNGKSSSYAISGFDHLAQLSLDSYAENKMEIGELDIHYNNNRSTLSFFSKKDSAHILDIPLRDKLLYLTKYNDQVHINKNELILDTENDQVKIRFVFQEYNYEVINDTIKLNHARALLFLKTK